MVSFLVIARQYDDLYVQVNKDADNPAGVLPFERTPSYYGHPARISVGTAICWGGVYR